MNSFMIGLLVIHIGFACTCALYGWSKGYSGMECAILGLCLGIIGFIIIACRKDVYHKEAQTTYVKYEDSDDELENLKKLKMYKELLDSGAITQEEYDKKKAMLL